MKPRISLITLGVTDLHRSLRFYRDGLGLSTEGIVGEESADSRIRTGTCGRWPGIRSGRCRNRPGD